MAKDPVIALHRVGLHAFELSGLRTASVRDQMLRAQLLVERLFEYHDLNPGDDIVIVGAGAAGVCAALTAATLGINVTVFEKEAYPFHAQLGVPSRTLDPAEYDWPQPHFRETSYPFGLASGIVVEPMPLTFSADTAANLAVSWTRELRRNLRQLSRDRKKGLVAGTVDILYGVKLEKKYLRQPRRGIEIRDWDGEKKPRPFKAIISCVGMIHENTEIVTANTSFSGIKFWAKDLIAEQDLGRRSAQRRSWNVLISGSGDGAMQDVQRALTRKCGKALYTLLEPHLIANPKFDEHIRRLLLADDVARRSHAWASERRVNPKATVLRAWHEVYDIAVRDIYLAFDDATKQALSTSLFRDDADINLVWVMRSPHLAFSYSLNRFVTLLLCRLYADWKGRMLRYDPTAKAAADRLVEVSTDTRFDVQKRPVVLTCIEVRQVKSANSAHRCGSARGCHGNSHEARAADLHDTSSPVTLKTLGMFDAVVIRHGVSHKPFITPVSIPEQIVPFYHPD